MELAEVIDHTILKPDCTKEEIKQLCDEAREHELIAVCVPPYYVQDACRFLKESEVKVSTVIGYPFGYSATPAKVEEVKRAIDEGVDEVDAVVNFCAIKSGNWSFVRNDIDSMTLAAHRIGKLITIVFETSLLNHEEIKTLCEICVEIGVDFVKTSTAIDGKGTKLDTIKFLKDQLPEKIKIKASGGIRNRAFAKSLIAAGANRLASSSSLKILSE